MHDAHVGDLAELYAVGALDADDRERVDLHCATCAYCRRMVGDAEETVLLLERETDTELTPFQLDHRMKFRDVGPSVPRASLWLAIAAAFLIGLLPSVALLVQRSHPSAVSDAPVVAMIGSHFNHAQFSALAPGAPAAKVIYARDRSWIYVLVRSNASYGVYAVTAHGAQRLGATNAGASTSALFVPHASPADAIELRVGTSTVARAQLR